MFKLYNTKMGEWDAKKDDARRVSIGGRKSVGGKESTGVDSGK